MEIKKIIIIRNSSLREAMNSPLFTALRSGDILLDDHEGGCMLYEKRAQVEALLEHKKADLIGV